MKAVQHALMVAKSVGDSLGLGKRDVLDRARGGYIHKAEGGEVKSRHPALSIPGFHVREEIHGTPIFTGGRNAN
jgi:hypothetical protein